MATRSRIAIETTAGKVRSIYCHWDGYPGNNGKILMEHYTDKEKIINLIELGDISSLAPEVNTDLPHTFNSPVEGVVVAYGRDRKEKIKDYRDVNRTNSYTKSACGCSKLAGDAEWIEQGYRPYFVEDNLAKNWVNWWVYNPRYNWGDTPEIEALKNKRKNYGPKGP